MTGASPVELWTMIKAAVMPGRGKHERRHVEIDRKIDATDRQLEEMEVRLARIEARAALRRKKVDGSS